MNFNDLARIREEFDQSAEGKRLPKIGTRVKILKVADPDDKEAVGHVGVVNGSYCMPDTGIWVKTSPGYVMDMKDRPSFSPTKTVFAVSKWEVM